MQTDELNKTQAYRIMASFILVVKLFIHNWHIILSSGFLNFKKKGTIQFKKWMVSFETTHHMFGS